MDAGADQTTDHLSGAEKFVFDLLNWPTEFEVWESAEDYAQARRDVATLATYYEDKGRKAADEELTMIALGLKNLGIGDEVQVTPERGVEILAERFYSERRNAQEERDASDRAENRLDEAVAAAEEKGRSEERERLPRAMTEFERKAADREINREGPPDLGPDDVLRVTYRDLDPPSEEAIRAGQEAAFGRGWAIPEPIMVAILRAALASLDSEKEGS